MKIVTVDKVTESIIRRYINDLQERGKYSFYADEKKKETNHPDRRRDFRKPITITTINNYIRTGTCISNAKKRLSASLPMQKKNTPCVIHNTEAWPR